MKIKLGAMAALGCALSLVTPATASEPVGGLVSLDHYVRVRSTAPALPGQISQIYVRQVTRAGHGLGGAPAAGQVVLFIHGSGTPAEVAFDAPAKSFSWMAYLAEAGFNVFAMDMTGYGRSYRPPAMNDPCNLSPAAQAQLIPSALASTCPASHPTAITTMSSDWNDIDAVVDHLRAVHGVEQVALVAWSQGGPRAAGYAARNPAKVSRLVVLAPAYSRTGPTDAPDPLPVTDGPLTVQSRADFDANWARQLGCDAQFEAATADMVWSEMIASDPVGATWGPGVRRAPQVPTWGFNQDIVGRMQTPFLMVAGALDRQVLPQRVQELYADLGSNEKVLIDLACSSHNAMWEKNRQMLFQASLEWLRDGKVGGQNKGIMRMGY
jgi:pimeloyl-ACP methyl ester carboxylesterase